MEEKYSGLSNNSREFLELDDKIKENIIRRLKLVLEEYGEIFSIDDILLITSFLSIKLISVDESKRNPCPIYC